MDPPPPHGHDDHGNRGGHGHGHGNHDHEHDRNPDGPRPPQFIPSGLPMRGKHIPMTSVRRDRFLFPGQPAGTEPVWTRGMGPCQGIATYDSATGARTLTHLEGGQSSQIFNGFVAAVLSGTSTVFLLCGSDGSKEQFETVDAPKWRRGIELCMADDDMVGGNKLHLLGVIRWVVLWTDPAEDLRNGTVPGSFVIDFQGRYGRGIVGSDDPEDPVKD